MPALVLRESAPLRYGTFFYLYVMQGIPAGFGLTATYNYLIGRGLSAQAVGTFAAIVGLPWTFQFVWGPLIDKYQHSGNGHRKQWVVLTQLVAALASLSLLLVHDPVAQIGLLGGVFFVHSVFASIQDASVDAIAISVVPLAERGRVNAFMRAGFLLGWAAGGAMLAWVLHHGGFRLAASAQTVALLLLTALTFVIRLDRADRLLPRFGGRRAATPGAALSATTAADTTDAADDNPTLGWLFAELGRAMLERVSLRAFLVIFFAYLAGYLFSNAYTFQLIHALHWPDTDVSMMQGGWGSVVSLTVLLGGGVLVDKIGATRLQYAVMIVLAAFLLLFSSSAPLWSHRPVAFGGLVAISLADPLLSVAAMPLLMALCRPRIEGSQFTAYMALVNLCGVAASYLNGWLLAITTTPIIGLCSGMLVLGLVLVLRSGRARLIDPATLVHEAKVAAESGR